MRRIARLGPLVVIGALSMIAGAAARPETPDDRRSSIAELWQEPADLTTSDLFGGPWGASNRPDALALFTFSEAQQTDDLGGVRLWFGAGALGAAVGATGGFDQGPNDLRPFSRQWFIPAVVGGSVRFDYHAVHRGLLDRITPADVRWASRLLAGLS